MRKLASIQIVNAVEPIPNADAIEKIQREGVVLGSLAEEYDEDIGGRLSFKAINPKFLLKYDELGMHG
jgi:hypothetical protein